MGEGTVGKGNSAVEFLDLGVPALGDDALSVEILNQLPEALQLEISPEYVSDRFGLALVDDELLVLGIIARRHGAPGPFALAPGRCDLVADPLGGQLALELGKG